ncbi:hypothetical protein [Natronolimnohabitans innermongolicus]|uniref:Uncharacterized protein n=1 Tax=Natronolimnohabitans innermongolicus JCM 12255 TaxID=1227499 RepID=L9X833_9EURY|nr:hypothetical protein [Natronolimnohabitans innermongolicus]ELY57767.1 hypothetical protein C493_07754 [Natronolimnohabitans innermongolicus JCM 12255]
MLGLGLDGFDRTERLSLALTVVFLVTFAVTIRVDSVWLWLVWGIAMVTLSGAALVLSNYGEPPPSD